MSCLWKSIGVSPSLEAARCFHVGDLNQTSRDKFLLTNSTRQRSLPLEKFQMAPSSQAPSAVALQEAVRRGRDHLLGAPPPVHQSAPTALLPSCLSSLHVEELEYLAEDPDNPASLPSQCWVPLRVVKKKQSSPTSRLPVVIFIHCTGSDKNSQALRQAQYAERGYLTAAIDTRYHGARVDPNLPYQQAIVRSWLQATTPMGENGSRGGGDSTQTNTNSNERPFLLDVVWDIQRLLDYLVSRTDVDPQRIGAIGESLGGMILWLLAATDDRVAAVAPICGVQDFRYAVENDCFHERVRSIPNVFTQAAKDLKGNEGPAQVDKDVVAAVWEKIMPGLLSNPPEDGYDAPYSLGLIAPRPCLILTGELDQRTPLNGVKRAVEHARKIYKKVLEVSAAAEGGSGSVEESEERLKLFVEAGIGHEYTPTMHREIEIFMDKWLL
jgi:dienelactone hydrolase